MGQNTSLEMVEYMNKFNYTAYSLTNTKIKVDITKLTDTIDVLFLS